MAEGVKVHIDDATIISALNTPGGAVHEWRNETERMLLAQCRVQSPVNDVLNAMHRGGVVGEYAASWVTDRYGNGHRIGFRIENFADHAVYVEEGRRGSAKTQTFSWTRWGGEIRTVGIGAGAVAFGTRPRDGKHILRDAANAILAAQTGGSVVPLV